MQKIKSKAMVSSEWNNLSELQRNKINEGSAQLKEGKGIPVEKVMKRLNKKYSIK